MHTSSRSSFLRLAACFAMAIVLNLFLGAAPALAVEPINKSFLGGVALHGYDAVAYFTQQKAVEGSDEFEYEWMDATWRFINAKNRDLFAATPAKYAPQYGGYCAYAVSQGGTADIDPEAWTIVNGKLYLNVSKSIRKTWEKNISGYITAADANWPKIVGK